MPARPQGLDGTLTVIARPAVVLTILAACTTLPAVVASLQAAWGLDVAALLERHAGREAMVAEYIAGYRRYGWPVASLDDFRLAPFHLLASEGGVHADRDHVWHMEALARLCRVDPALLLATPYLVVDVTDGASRRQGISWWEDLTAHGVEGMVVKPRDFIARDWCNWR